jgi:DNA-directed RNA polymerase subunit RPC12/RpoP
MVVKKTVTIKSNMKLRVKSKRTKSIITGPYTHKRYKCTSCGHESLHGTNHYGEIYPRCRNCGWKNPMELGQVHRCLEKLPEGWGVPEPWKRVKLGDIVNIEKVRVMRGKK